MPNLCGVNQKLIVEALAALKKGKYSYLQRNEIAKKSFFCRRFTLVFLKAHDHVGLFADGRW